MFDDRGVERGHGHHDAAYRMERRIARSRVVLHQLQFTRPFSEAGLHRHKAAIQFRIELDVVSEPRVP